VPADAPDAGASRFARRRAQYGPALNHLRLKYVGPVDGHDERAVEAALRHARGFGGPVLVHVVTRKGMGYAPAEADEAEQMHSTVPIDPVTGDRVHETTRKYHQSC